jgi:hypothetical protein
MNWMWVASERWMRLLPLVERERKSYPDGPVTTFQLERVCRAASEVLSASDVGLGLMSSARTFGHHWAPGGRQELAPRASPRHHPSQRTPPGASPTGRTLKAALLMGGRFGTHLDDEVCSNRRSMAKGGLTRSSVVERVTRIETAWLAWKSDARSSSGLSCIGLVDHCGRLVPRHLRRAERELACSAQARGQQVLQRRSCGNA